MLLIFDHLKQSELYSKNRLLNLNEEFRHIVLNHFNISKNNEIQLLKEIEYHENMDEIKKKKKKKKVY